MHAIYFVVKQKEMGALMNLIGGYSQDKSSIFIQNLKREDITYAKIDYAKCFDPKTCSWKYEHQKYMKQLENLAKSYKENKL